MVRDIITGLDVGTTMVRTIVASTKDKNKDARPKVIGMGQVPSTGMRRGVVIDIDEMIQNIKKSLEQAEQSSGVPIERVYLSIGGSHITCQKSSGTVAISRADGEISEDDIIRVVNGASAISLSPNREILHIIPREFTIDGQKGIQDPLGMSGVRLEVEALIIEGSTPFIKNLTKCVSGLGVQINGLVLDSLAASQAVLSKRQKELGVLTLDFGGGTVGMTVYEEGNLLHAHSLPIGASHITNDVAIGLRTGIDLAEKVKLEYGFSLSSEIGKRDMVDLSKIDEREEGVVSRREIAHIIEERIREIFSLVNKDLRKISKERLLPAGVVLVGGGAKIPGLIDLAKEELKLPVQLGFPLEVDGIVDKVDDPSFATAVGLIFWGIQMQVKGGGQGTIFSTIPSLRMTVGKMRRWFETFLP